MSKTFRKNYYDDDNVRMKRVGKSHKQNRQKVRNYLRRIDINNINEDEDLEEFEENFEEEIEY